jgi:hypothetical protein
MEVIMKRTLLLSLLLVAFAATVQAAQLANNDVNTDGTSLFGGVNQTAAEASPTPIIKFSTKVNGLINGTTSGYMIMTKHQTGSKAFGTASDSTSIFWRQEAAAKLVNTYSISTSSSNFTAANAWTAY